MKTTTLFAALLSVLFFSCEKDTDSNGNCAITTAAIAGSYKITAVTYKASTGATETDVFGDIPACQRDDIYTFKTDNTYNYTDAGTVCTPPGTTSGAWSVAGNEMQIDRQIVHIASFDCNKLTVQEGNTATGEMQTTVYTRQ